MSTTHPTTDYNPAIRHARLGRGQHRLETQTWFALPVAEVFPFFTDVENLERITPPELGFRIVTPTPVEIEQGTLFEYRLRLWGRGVRLAQPHLLVGPAAPFRRRATARAL